MSLNVEFASKKESKVLFLDLIEFLERCQSSGFLKLWKNHISFQAISGMNVNDITRCLKELFSYLRVHKHKLNGEVGEWCIDEIGNRFVDLLIPLTNGNQVVRYNYYSRKCDKDFGAFLLKDNAYYGFTIETDTESESKKDA
jgi:hypothetical protein